MSWDVPAHGRAPIALYGTKGSLQAPDPNQFGGATRINSEGEWATVGEEAPQRKLNPATLAKAVQAMGRGVDPVTGEAISPDTTLRFGDRRGLGLLDLVAAIREGRPPRANGHLAVHVLETLLALEASANGAGRIAITSTIARPDPVSPGEFQ
jgi:predicted dehydrogenase